MTAEKPSAGVERCVTCGFGRKATVHRAGEMGHAFKPPLGKPKPATEERCPKCRHATKDHDGIGGVCTVLVETSAGRHWCNCAAPSATEEAARRNDEVAKTMTEADRQYFLKGLHEAPAPSVPALSAEEWRRVALVARAERACDDGSGPTSHELLARFALEARKLFDEAEYMGAWTHERMDAWLDRARALAADRKEEG